MIWITTNETFLVEIGLKPIPYISGGVEFGGKEYFESAQYYEIDKLGNIIKEYQEARPFSLEGEMTISYIHLVIENALYEFYWSLHLMYTPHQSVEKVLSDLRIYELPMPFNTNKIIYEYEYESSINNNQVN